MRLNRDHTVPIVPEGLGHAILLIAAHKIYVNTRFHRWPQFVEQSSNPGNIALTTELSAVKRLLRCGINRFQQTTSGDPGPARLRIAILYFQLVPATRRPRLTP